MNKCVAICFFVLASLYSATAQEINQTSLENYDLGCYRRHDEFLKEDDMLRALREGATLPSCVEGGLWRTVQCRLYNCYCVYVDTGNAIPEMEPSNLNYGELRKICPVRTETELDRCVRPPLNYPCNLTQEKYHFNSATGACEKISYGCYGFAKRSLCEESCVITPEVQYTNCTYPVDFGDFCEDGEAERYFYDDNVGRCRSFPYQGCGGNTNNYEERWKCEESCVPGNVQVMINVQSRYRFRVTIPVWVATKHRLSRDSLIQMSINPFIEITNQASKVDYIRPLTTTPPATTTTATTTTTEEPTTTSTKSTTRIPRPTMLPLEVQERRASTPDVICQLPQKTGMCRGYFPRWYFDHSVSRCKSFIYGGCLANGNNFRDYTSCGSYCNAQNPPTEEDKNRYPLRG